MRAHCLRVKGLSWLLMPRRSRGSDRRELLHLRDLGVEVLPVLGHKIDLPSAMPDNARQEIEDVIGIDTSGYSVLCKNL